MTTIAENAARHSALDRDVARAWHTYHAETVALDAEAYASREPELWQQLQDALDRIETLRTGYAVAIFDADGHGPSSER